MILIPESNSNQRHYSSIATMVPLNPPLTSLTAWMGKIPCRCLEGRGRWRWGSRWRGGRMGLWTRRRWWDGGWGYGAGTGPALLWWSRVRVLVQTRFLRGNARSYQCSPSIPEALYLIFWYRQCRYRLWNANVCQIDFIVHLNFAAKVIL